MASTLAPEQLAEIVAKAIEAATDPLLQRIIRLEQRVEQGVTEADVSAAMKRELMP